MENASKALMIAAAIIIAILIIAIAMYVYNSSAGLAQNANLDSEAIQQYNEPFERYGGEHVTGANAIALAKKIVNHNRSNRDVSKQIELTTTQISTDGSTSLAPSTDQVTGSTNVKNGLLAGAAYSIRFAYDSGTGYITKCSITKISS